MPRTDARPAPLARAVVVASLALALAAGAHVVGGGAVPGVLALAALGALSLAVVSGLSRFRTTLPRLVVVLVGAQAALHRGLDALAGPTSGCTHPGSGTVLAHDHSLHAASACLPTAAHGTVAGGATGAGHQMLASSALPMLVGHGLAVLGTALLLARGEAAARRVVAWLTPRVTVLRAPAVRVETRSAAPAGRRAPSPAPRDDVAPTRGPPAPGLYALHVLAA